MYIIDLEKESEYDRIDDDGAPLDEDDEGGSGELGENIQVAAGKT